MSSVRYGQSIRWRDRRACCILGAGYSHVAGLPLAKDLLATEAVPLSDAAAGRFRAVWDDFAAWRQFNPSREAEEYLTELYHAPRSQTWPTRRTPISNLESDDLPLLRAAGIRITRTRVPFSWATELIAAVIATPRGPDRAPTSWRYAPRVTFPPYCGAHVAFWLEVTALFESVSALTTNYDFLVERALRHRPMKRGFGPACHYGGLPTPQVLRGSQLPWRPGSTSIAMEGPIPVYKLHGSLNWCWRGSRLGLYQDARPVFRHGGEAAIVPPIREKDVPMWLEPVWRSAEEALSGAEVWIVCGYSLPHYDTAIHDLLQRAARGKLHHIFVLDPYASTVALAYGSLAPDAEVHRLPGLPDGTECLRGALERTE